MVASRIPVYYTFQLHQSHPFMVVNVHKWEEDASQPLVTYQVHPEGRPGAGMCSCPAYRVCKHTKAVLEAMRDGKINELWKWKWTEKGGWEESDDIL